MTDSYKHLPALTSDLLAIGLQISCRLREMRDVPDAIDLLKTRRAAYGWSTREVAVRVQNFGAEIGDEVRLTQQAVSFFETGKAKSVPRWMQLFALLTSILALPEEERALEMNSRRRQPLRGLLSEAAVKPLEAAQVEGQRSVDQQATPHLVLMPVVLPSEPALARMFEGLLRAMDRETPLDEQARLLARRLPIGLSQLRDLLPAAPKAAEPTPAPSPATPAPAPR